MAAPICALQNFQHLIDEAFTHPTKEGSYFVTGTKNKEEIRHVSNTCGFGRASDRFEHVNRRSRGHISYG
jgi:hypothetical protein